MKLANVGDQSYCSNLSCQAFDKRFCQWIGPTSIYDSVDSHHAFGTVGKIALACEDVARKLAVRTWVLTTRGLLPIVDA